MYRVKFMPDGGCAVLDNDSVYVFDKLGKCIKEKQPLYRDYTDGMVTLPIASLVTCNGEYDIAIFDGENFTSYKPNCEPASNIAMMFNFKGGFLRMLSHKGVVESEEPNGRVVKNRYQHLIFIYNAGTDIKSIMGEYLLEKCY